MWIIQFCVYIQKQNIRRIDLYLWDIFPDISRSYINKLILTGHIRVNGQTLWENRRVKLWDTIDIEFVTEKYYLTAENIPLEIVFENTDFAIINKDPGMNTHTFPWEYGKTGTLLNALLYHFGNRSVINGVERPWIIHRLDKDTSGLIIIAKNDCSMKALQKKIADREIRKLYYVVVLGLVQDRGEDLDDHKKMTTKNPIDPKLARTKFTLLEHIDSKYSLLEIEIFTGRTHQIRVHMTDIGHPIIGDKVYGNEVVNIEVVTRYWLTRQWLHARKTIFNLFWVDYEFVAPLKRDIASMLEYHGIELDQKKQNL